MSIFEVIQTGHTFKKDNIKVRDWVEGCKHYSMDNTHNETCLDIIVETAKTNKHTLVVSDWMSQVTQFTNDLTYRKQEFSAVTNRTRDRELVLSKWLVRGGLLVLSKQASVDFAVRCPKGTNVVITSPIKAGVLYGKFAPLDTHIRYLYSGGSNVGAFALKESIKVASMFGYQLTETTVLQATKLKAVSTTGKKSLSVIELEPRDPDLTYFRLAELKDRTDIIINKLKTGLIPVSTKLVLYCHSKDQATYIVNQLGTTVKTFTCQDQDTVKEKAALVDFHFCRQKSVLVVTLPRLLSAITSGLHADSIVFVSPPPDTITMNRRLYDKDTPKNFVLFKDKNVGAAIEAETILTSIIKETRK